MRIGVDLDTEMLERSPCLRREIGGISGEDARGALKEDDARLGRVDVAEVAMHIETSDVGDCAGEFDAGGPSSDNNEVEGRVRALLHHLPLSKLKGEQNAAANFGGVFDGLEAGRERTPFVVAEVRMRSAGGDDEVIKCELRSRGTSNGTRCGVDANDFIHEHGGVGLVAEDGADGLGYVGGREDGEGDLIEQRLKGVVVAAIDEGNVDGQVGESTRGVEARKAATDDEHAGAGCGERISGLGHGG